VPPDCTQGPKPDSGGAVSPHHGVEGVLDLVPTPCYLSHHVSYTVKAAVRWEVLGVHKFSSTSGLGLLPPPSTPVNPGAEVLPGRMQGAPAWNLLLSQESPQI
jgi:hypothetical protein